MDVASERIGILMSQASEAAAAGDLGTASRRVAQARAVSLRCNARIPLEYRMRFCPKCHAYYSSATAARRLESRRHRLAVKCLACGHAAYYPYLRERRRRRSSVSRSA